MLKVIRFFIVRAMIRIRVFSVLSLILGCFVGLGIGDVGCDFFFLCLVVLGFLIRDLFFRSSFFRDNFDCSF